MKYCVNCGAEIPAGSNFCIKCGTPVEETVTQNVTNQTTGTGTATPNVAGTAEKTKGFAVNYWSWLVESIKHPFQASESAHAYFGLVSFVVLAILNSTVFYLIYRYFQNGISTYSSSLKFVTVGTFVVLFIAYAVLYAAKLAVGYLFQKKSGNKTFFEYTNTIAHNLNFTLVFSLLMILTTFLFPTLTEMTSSEDSFKSFIYKLMFIIILASFQGTVFLLSAAVNAATDTSTKLDSFYKVVLISVIFLIISYVVFRGYTGYETQQLERVFSSITSEISSLFSSALFGI
ncbi:zinc ribbon domain-containing protein [Paucilactobacillus nenjiangensis]|jgi:hypothetical protein|uniref:Zinc ribbon domain-containing protein n=1 Tax=Paucilactobacillus nenjiangensis TaxID=1296540 RepID=A0A5P1WY61_9LACO|nr:zinc ribbon domain-containing protein [Paucilactobacillus nenjiangensis]QER66592.1 zinc ribbon domain-containing protein [Paucilactobacillus nenjiangensis]